MNPRTTGILLLVTAALGAFVYFYEIEGEDRRAEAEAEEKRLFPELEAEQISSLQLTTSDGKAVRMERSNGGWALSEPLAFPADALAVDGLASNLASLSSEVVLEDPQQAEEYGLGDGARVVRFSAGNDEHALRFGRKTPIGSNSYLQVEGSQEIVTVPTYKAQSFEKSLTDLRERRILDFDTDAVRRIEASWAEGSVTLERVVPAGAADGEGADAAAEPPEPEPTWRLTAPVEGRADDEAIASLLSDLSFLRADGFVDDPSEEALAGFEPPLYEIALYGEAGEEGTPPVWRLALGPTHEGDKRLVRAAEPSLYTIAASRQDDFPRQVVAYRFKRLSDFRINEAAQVDLFFHPAQGDPVAISAERTADGWTSGPEVLAPGRVARIVSELSSLDAGDIFAEALGESELEALGLGPPNTIVTVFGGAEGPADAEAEAAPAPLPRLAEIHIGNVEGSEWILARAAGDPAVYRLSYELAEHVPVSLEAFRNRFRAEDQPAEQPTPADAGDALPELLSPSEESP